MKKILGIIVLSLMLSSCGTPGHYQSIQISANGFKASAITWDGGYGLSKEHNTLEAAVFAAIRSCMGSNYEICEVDMINDRKADLIEKKEWKSKYQKNNHKYEFVKSSDGWTSAKLKKNVASNKTTASNKSPNTTSSKKTEGSSGTAFFISNNYLITNHHVVKGCNNNSKIIYQTNEIDAQLIAKDKFLDLALLKVDVDNDTYISISGQAPSKLQRIIVAGYPFGKYLSDDMKFTSGIISSLKGLGDDSTRLQIDAALNPGNSGGPIIDENTGELVAVAVAGLRKDKTEAVNFGIKAGSVKNFLESNQIDTTLLKKKYSRAGVAKLLESATMYTFCE